MTRSGLTTIPTVRPPFRRDRRFAPHVLSEARQRDRGTCAGSPPAEIKQNDWHLHVSRYVDTSQEEERTDVADPCALAYHADLRWLGKIRGAARARYHDDRLDLSGCGEKVRKLIADAVVADGVQVLVKEVQLFSPEFEEKVEALRTDEAKASEMEHAIRHEISVHLEENPAFYQSLRERLEAIIEERRQERLDAARQLSLLNSLSEELKGEQTRAQDIGLDARGFAIYGLLEEQRPMPVREHAAPYNAANRDLASLIDEEVAPFTELVDWWQKDDLQRQMRSKIKRQLRASGIEAEAVESLAANIVDLAKVRTDR